MAKNFESVVVVVGSYSCVGYRSLFNERTEFHCFTIARGRCSNGIIDDLGWDSSGNCSAKVSVIMKICLIRLPATLVRVALTDFTMEPLHVEVVLPESFSKIFKQTSIY